MAARLIGGSRSSRYRSAELAKRLEGFMKRVPVIHRHFAGMIELRTIDDNFRLQFCSDSRARMERGHFVHSPIIRRSDIHGHLVGVRIVAAVEPDIRLGGPRTHYKDGNQAPITRSLQLFFEIRYAAKASSIG